MAILLEIFTLLASLSFVIIVITMIILFSIIFVVVISVTLVQVMVAFVNFSISVFSNYYRCNYQHCLREWRNFYHLPRTKSIDRFEDLVINTSRETRGRQNSQ